MTNKTWVGLVTLLSFGLSCQASGYHQDHPSLSMYGETLPNACSTTQKTNLRKTLITSDLVHVAEAWRAIDTILCGHKDEASQRYVKSLIPQKIHKALESTGDPPKFEIVRRDELLVENLLAGGRAWSASLRTAPRKIELQYFANEACVKSVTLKFTYSKWLVDEIGEACD